jgi:holin-like protein
MILSLTVILICQLVGEVVVRGSGLPLPGPVLGMVLLLAILALRDRFRAAVAPPGQEGPLEATGKGLLANLSLLFVVSGMALAASLVLSTIAALVATVLTFVLAARWFGVPGEQP